MGRINIEKLKTFKEKYKLDFMEVNHCYYYDDYPIHSVSMILRDSGISPDYSYVNPEILEKAQKRGTAIHFQVEDALKTGNLNEVEDEAMQIVNYIKSKAKEGEIFTEQEVYSLNKIKCYGGRFDILIETKEGETILYDIKTYKSWGSCKEQQVAWQLSLYAKAIEEMQEGTVDKLAVLRFKDDELVCNEVKRKSENQINNLLKTGTLSTPAIPMPDETVILLKSFIKKEKELNSIEELIKNEREKIYKYMLENDIIKAKSLDGSLTITLIKPSQTTTLDTKKLKKEEPEIFEKYKKLTNREGHIRIN